MDTFLGNVAKFLYDKYGDDISTLRILLPNVRSRLFFLEELGGLVKRPTWPPEYLMIDQFMSQASGLVVADRVRAVIELYEIYSRYHKETIDSFYFWGEMLLDDFDSIDKYMVDADMLFANISDLKKMDALPDIFSQQQKQVIQRFWENFGMASDDGPKRDFLRIWQTLATIYHEFRNRLEAVGLGYSGMIQRRVAEKLIGGEVSFDMSRPFAVIGFNALSKCEKVLFDHLNKQYDTMFFWDYDDYYVGDTYQESGLFVRENIRRYPHPTGFCPHTDNFNSPKRITSVAVPSNALQCKQVKKFLTEVTADLNSDTTIDDAPMRMPGKETAIVLTDESLLVPLLHSIPEEFKAINISMGYPLRQTLVYSFVERLLRLQTHTRTKSGEPAFYHVDVCGLLTHPFITEAEPTIAAKLHTLIIERSKIYVPESMFSVSELLSYIFAKQSDWKGICNWIIEILSRVTAPKTEDSAATEESNLRREYAGIITDTLRRLANSLENCRVEIETGIFSSLARRMLQNVRIPFIGEPLQGLQIMGILETRNIDFENVMIMSLNDDNYPGNSTGSSFIPYNLRVGYGLPTSQQSDAIKAYYFYRLLQRSRNIELLYTSRSDENSTGEPSRYIHQLEYETRHHIEHREIGLNAGITSTQEIVVAKDAAVLERLQDYLEGRSTLSPTALNSYLECPLKFYFRYVARLNPETEISEEIDMPMFGTILHKTMELLYRPLLGVEHPEEHIRTLIGSHQIDVAVEQAVSETYFNGEAVPTEDYEGQLLMVRDIVVRYVNGNILPYDGAHSDYVITSLEQKLSAPFEFECNGERCRVIFSGLADRVDQMPGGTIRIVDYKTGTPHHDFASVEALFGDTPPERNPAVLQTLLYSMIVERMQQQGELSGTDVYPSLYYVRLMHTPEYSPLLSDKTGSTITGYTPWREDFERCLSELLSRMFDPSEPYRQCPDPAPCNYCDFNELCKR